MYLKHCSFWSSFTQEGEPCEEGRGAEAEQWQKQDDEVERDSVIFTPIMRKRVVVRRIVSIVVEAKRAVAVVPSRSHVWVWTQHW